MKAFLMTALLTFATLAVATPVEAETVCDPTGQACVRNATLGALGACADTSAVGTSCYYVSYRNGAGWCAIESHGVEERLVCVPDVEDAPGPVVCDNRFPTAPCVGLATQGAIGACAHAVLTVRCGYVSYRSGAGWCLLTENDIRVVCVADL